MNYKFPRISVIEDVLPHIEGRPEFVVAERAFGFVINYNVSMSDTFDMRDSDDEGNYVYDWAGAIRRECRGLKFYPNGEIAARPLHKFFNIGEREETQPHRLDLSEDHLILEKRDGSMLHPILFEGQVRWCTKMGITTVSEQAEKFISQHSKYEQFAAWCILNSLTPIFEYTSPENRIVVSYEKDELILLAVRHNITGEYLDVGH